jgi:hypothetical protein
MMPCLRVHPTSRGYGTAVSTTAGALPNVVVIGAMKCGTTAMHRYLDAHPDVAMAPRKEVGFFVGGPNGHWHRGWDWYASLFDASVPVRGESSPGYTSPSHPQVAARMASRLPDVRLVYLVRDPVRRAVSQFRHHQREGDEHRPVAEAILDPDSQYIARSRYHERLEPFLRHFTTEQILVVVQERLLANRRAELSRVFAHVGADPQWWGPALQQRWHVGADEPSIDAGLRRDFARCVYDDTDKLRVFMGDDLAEWG